MGAELALEADPAGGRMRVIEVRALAVEPLAAVLLLVSPRRNPDVGLGSELSLFQRVHRPSDSRIAGKRTGHRRPGPQGGYV
jgi:hypothetical protein